MGSFPLYYYFSSIISGFRFRLVLSTSLTKSSKSVAKISHKKFMIYISHKQQAKIISQWTLWSSTDITNKEKKLVSKRPGFPGNYFWLLKKLVSGPCRALLDLYFFIIKSNKQQASGQQLAVSLFFFIQKSNKQQTAQQQAPSLTLDTCSRIL